MATARTKIPLGGAKRPPSSAAYEAFAPVYDRWQELQGGQYTDLIMPLIVETLIKQRLRPTTAADLACGTGTLAIYLAKMGIRTTGVDLSAAMLAQARKKSAGKKLPLSWRQGELTAPTLTGPIDLICCFYTSLNHLRSTAELKRAFSCMRRALAPNGHVLFDLNTVRGFAQLWKGTKAVHDSSFSLIMECAFEQRTRRGSAQLTVFNRAGSGFRRSRGRLEVRAFTNAEVSAALRHAGLRIVERRPFNPFGPGYHRAIKSFWVCKPA